MNRPLNHDEKLWAFRKATHGFSGVESRWKEYAETGLTDAQLAEVLRCELGIFGGSGGPDEISISYQGAGLRIWASWSVHNTCSDPPLFAGAQTVAMAREVYGIPDPDDRQLALF